MTNVYSFITAQAEETLPLEEQPSVLFPPLYDIVWSIIPLAVLLILFWKFVMPRYQETLTEREDRIEGGIAEADAAKAEAKAALEKYNAQLADARAEAADIRDQARERGKQIEADIKADAQDESKRIIAAGEKQLEASREQVVAELRNDIGQNSITLAEKLLGTELSDTSKRSGTIDNFLSDLDNVAPARK